MHILEYNNPKNIYVYIHIYILANVALINLKLIDVNFK